MCRRITCLTCNKPGWIGCGDHIEMVLSDVPPDDRCNCPRDKVRGEGIVSKMKRLFG